jgi:hypothetical protein
VNTKEKTCLERRDWDLNPGGAKLHKISSLAPYQARLSRHTIVFFVILSQDSYFFDQTFFSKKV